MAAVTLDSVYRNTFTSNQRVLLAEVTCAATGDTWATGLTLILNVQATPKADEGDTFASASGGTVTFGYDGGGAASFWVLVIGS